MSSRPLSRVSRAGRALWVAATFLLRHPASWLAAYALTVLVSIPVTAVMAQTIGAAADGFPAPLGRGAVDVDWWTRVQQQDAPLAAEFSPRTLGFAAPLDSFSAVFEGPPAHAWVVVFMAVTYGVAWAVLWSIVLTRFGGVREAGIMPAGQAVGRFLAPMVIISAAASLAGAVLYITVHPFLFDWLFPFAVATADSREAFLIRTILYAVFGALLLIVAVTADLARAHVVLTGGSVSVVPLATAWRLLRTNAGAVAIVCSALLLLHAAVLSGYGAGEVLGGARLGGWRAVAVAQLYVVSRIVLRLSWGTALFALVQQEHRAASR